LPPNPMWSLSPVTPAKYLLGVLTQSSCFMFSNIFLRMALNAVLPTTDVLAPIHRAVVIQNKHLRQLYTESQPTLPEVIHVLEHCPKYLDRSYTDVVAQLEHILPNSRNIDFLELNQRISMAPYILLPSLPSVQKTLRTRKLLRSVLIDVGANNFYGYG